MTAELADSFGGTLPTPGAGADLTVKDLATGQQHEVPVAELEMKVRGLLD